MRRKPTLLLAAAVLAACASHHDDLAGWAPQDPAPEAPPDMTDELVGEAGAGPLRTELTIEEAVTEALAAFDTKAEALQGAGGGFGRGGFGGGGAAVSLNGVSRALSQSFGRLQAADVAPVPRLVEAVAAQQQARAEVMASRPGARRTASRSRASRAR